MTSLSRRVRVARIAVAFAALGATLVGAASAQGAMGTAPPVLASQRPSLVSVTNAPPGSSLVNFCFNTPTGLAIAPPNPPGTYDPTQFFLGGYHSANRLPAISVTQVNNTCLQATFGGEVPKYSFGQVTAGATIVTVGGSPFANDIDSSPLVNSDGHNGTRGLSYGLDLQSVAFPGGNRIAFAFDQDIGQDDPSQPLPAGCPDAVPPLDCTVFGLGFYDQSGQLHGFFGAHLIAISGNLAIVEYDNPPDAVNEATIALADRNVFLFGTGGGSLLVTDTPPSGGATSRLSVATGLAGSGQSADLYLDSAQLVNNGDSAQVAYNFKAGGSAVNIAVSGPNSASCFRVETSDGSELIGDSVVTLGNTATVTFNGLQDVSELAVSASVLEGFPRGEGEGPCASGAVHSTTGQVSNDSGGKPVGGNAGAFQSGYTTAPEANGLTVSGDHATVPVDQRVDPANVLLTARLVNAQGAIYGPPPSNAAVVGNGSPNGAHSVVYSFDPTALASAAGIYLPGDELRTFGVPFELDPQFSIDQIAGRS